MRLYSDAIGSIESAGSGGYNAIGPANSKGQKPYGKHQVMDFNIGPWSQAALGRTLTPQEFLSDADAQEKIFEHRFGQYVNKYGPEGAAKAWFAGEGGMSNPNARDVLGTSVSAYGQKFNKAMGNDVSPISQVFPSARGQQNTQPDDGSLSARFIAGGPGALFGAPEGVFQKADGSQGYDLSNGLIGAGAALASISDAKQGAAIASMMVGKDGYDTHYDPQTGTIFRINKKTGAVQATRNPNYEGPKVDPSVLKTVGEGVDKLSAMHNTARDAAGFADDIKNGKLDLSIASQGIAAWENMFGKSSESTQKYNAFQAFREQIKNNILIQNKGTQTEGDAQRAADQFLAGLASKDNKSAQQALEKLVETNGREIQRGSQTLIAPYKSQYNRPEVWKPYEDQINPMVKFYSDRSAAQQQPQQPASGGFKVLNVR